MVRALHGDDGCAAGVGAGEAQREVVRLAAGVHDEHGAERRRDERREPIREPRQALVEETRVRVEPPQRAGGRRGHARMAVAEHGHVVDHVEVGAAVGVVEVLAPAADQLGRPGVEHLLGVRDGAPAQREQVRGVAPRGGGVDAEQGGGVRAQREPRGPQGRPRASGKRVERRERELHVHVGRQDIAGWADRAERRARRDRVARLHGGRDPGQAEPEARAAGGLVAQEQLRRRAPLDHARVRGAHRRSLAGEHVDAEVDGGRLAGVRRRARADPRLAPAPDGHVARRHGRGGGEPRRRAPAALGERLASRPEVDRYRPATAGLDEGRRREEAAQLRGAGVRLEPARGAGHRLRQLGRDGEQDGEPGPGDLGRVDDVAVVRLEHALERAAERRWRRPVRGRAGTARSARRRSAGARRGSPRSGPRSRPPGPRSLPRPRRPRPRARRRGRSGACRRSRSARMAPAGPRGRAGRGCCSA